MARIRSVHPGLFTDEAFMSLSMEARVLIIGIWTEADDNGVFEWKPITLKARILPADNVDTVTLLAELARLDFVNRFENGASTYGAVRNFHKYQRPKKPKIKYVLPDELRTYVGIRSGDVSEVENQFPTEEELPSQREEGGGRLEEDDVSSLRSEARARENEIERKPQARLTDLWKPLEAGYLYAKSIGLTDAEIVREAERFRNHAKQSDRVCSDWDAAWRNWALKALELLGRSMPSTQSNAPVGIHVKADTPQWDAWRRHRGKSAPRDKDNGWFFPSEWPPGAEPKEAKVA
jgi:hypothetical protein